MNLQTGRKINQPQATETENGSNYVIPLQTLMEKVSTVDAEKGLYWIYQNLKPEY